MWAAFQICENLTSQLPFPLLEGVLTMDTGKIGIIDGLDIDKPICELGRMEGRIGIDDEVAKLMTNAEGV